MHRQRRLQVVQDRLVAAPLRRRVRPRPRRARRSSVRAARVRREDGARRGLSSADGLERDEQRRRRERGEKEGQQLRAAVSGRARSASSAPHAASESDGVETRRRLPLELPRERDAGRKQEREEALPASRRHDRRPQEGLVDEDRERRARRTPRPAATPRVTAKAESREIPARDREETRVSRRKRDREQAEEREESRSRRPVGGEGRRAQTRAPSARPDAEVEESEGGRPTPHT